MTAYDHVPVLGQEVLEAFNFGKASFVVDGTLGLGGHSEKLLQSYTTMRILGFDWDAAALATARERLFRSCQIVPDRAR